MQWSVYWDRPQALINDYLESINGFIQYAYPNWGSSNRGVHAKGEYGTASLRADSMGLLDTEGRWILPQDSGATTTTSGQAVTTADHQGNFNQDPRGRYYMFTGLQYNTSPIV